MFQFRKQLTAIALLLALGSCAPRARPPAVPPPPATALTLGVAPAPSLPALDHANARVALAAFRISCPALLRRVDASGLTRPSDWAGACIEVEGLSLDQRSSEAAEFFRRHFASVRVGDGAAFATGYFEPEIAGSRTRAPGYQVPVYAVPPDLVEQTLEGGGKRRGRLEAGLLVPYHERAAIDDGALAGRGLEIGWAADPIDLFFLQIQGSGRLALPDGGVMRIGYAGQNGREYVAIGKLLKERGLLGDAPVTMQGIVAWLRANPEQGRAIMRENRSYVFFRELTGPGPLGALDLPVTPRATVAADPKFVPLGAPVMLSLDASQANGLWVAQDTGGAIKGANRFDTFWGAGQEAATIAGGMQARGQALILLPKAAAARLTGGRGATARR